MTYGKALRVAIILLFWCQSLWCQWNWQTPIPQGNTLLKVQFTDTTYGWAVGEYGTILHTTTGGASWYEQEYARTDNVLSISMVSGDEGWAVGDNGIILHTIDRGDDWLEQVDSVTTGLNDVVFLDSLTGWAVGDNEVILHTTDGGTTWPFQHHTFVPNSINAITMLSTTEGWAVGQNRVVYHTTDGGTSWTQRTVGTGAPVPYSAVAFADPSVGFITGGGGEIYRTENGGLTWTLVPSGVTSNLNHILMRNSFVGWIAGDAGIILSTINGGQSWSREIVGDGSNFNALSQSTGVLWAVGEFGRIITSTNGGVSWSSLDTGPRLSANWIDFPSGTTGYAVGQTGLILRTTNAGATWDTLNSPVRSISCYGVKFTDNTHGWAVGDNGTILRTTDGSTWSTQTSPVTHSLFGVTFGDPSSGWIIGGEYVGLTGVILHSTNGGSSWNIQYNAVPKILFGAAFPNSAAGWAVGQDGYIIHTTNGGSSWAQQTSGTTSTLFWCSFADNSTGWAVGDTGVIIHTTNGGALWTKQASGTTLPLYSIANSGNFNACVVGETGTILQTTDGGVHWVNQYSRTLYGIFGVAFPTPLSVWTCGDYGTVLHQTNQFMTGSVSGLVFNDANNNGTFDPGETGLSGWTIKLEGEQSTSVSTGGDGSFQFDNLPGGSYTLTEIVRPSWTQTFPVSPQSYTFTLNAETTIFAGNFGNYSVDAHAYPKRAGWNLVSLPLIVSDSRTSAIFPSAISSAFAYESGYLISDTLRHGVGYWIKFSSAQTAWIAGTPIDNDTIDLQQGWNLIGSINDSVLTGSITTIPPGITPASYFGYTSGYAPASVLVPGQGYWIKSSQSGKSILASGHHAGKSETAASDGLETFSSLTIEDGDGNRQILYFGSEPCEGSKSPQDCSGLFELPPVPPAGMFDARYASGTMVEFADANQGRDVPILISSTHYPVSVSWSVKDPLPRAALLLDGRDIPLAVNGRTSIGEPNHLRLHLSPAPATGLPKEFSLEQNYPNPFNPTTNFKFAIPSRQLTILRVYNVLGQEVQTLVNEVKEPGVYTISWDATNLPSGVYLYRLTAQNFDRTMKLLLIK